MKHELNQPTDCIVSLQVHRLVAVDHENHVTGIVSLSDILSFLVLKPFGK